MQGIPTPQTVPSGLAPDGHMPLLGSQVTAVMQSLGAGQLFGSPPTQIPDTQVSVWVHPSRSVQPEPSLATLHPPRAVQVPGWQVSATQVVPARQKTQFG